jgi:hypothetical protein
MKNVVDVFYNDIIENSKCSESITEYMLNKNIEGFNELLNNGIDRYVEFGRNLLITDVNEFTKELAKKINTNGFKVNFLDIYFDRCGNVSNVLVELEKEVM